MKLKSLFSLKAFLAAATLCASLTTQASGYLTDGPSTNAANPGVKIKRFFAHNAGGLTLIVETTKMKNPDNCNTVQRVHLKGDREGHDQMVAAALAAFASGKSIGMYSPGCEIIPFWGSGITTPIVHDLWIFN